MKLCRCERCGNRLEKKEDGLFHCISLDCGYTYTEDSLKTAYDKLEQSLRGTVRGEIDEAFVRQREEALANCHLNLWKEIHEQYTDSEKVLHWTGEIKKLAPSDFAANFYEIINREEKDKVVKFLDNIDVNSREAEIYAEEFINFTIRSLEKAYISPITRLIEAYKGFDVEKRTRLITKLNNEAEKLDNGIYDVLLPRDVFVIYSQKDIEKVIKIVERLEKAKISCFYAFRNLKNGANAANRYDENIFKAMENCQIVLFIASETSRNREGFYYNELQHLKRLKAKPRLEYWLDEIEDTSTKRFRKQLFGGIQCCREPDELVERVGELLCEADAETEEKASRSGNKYCKKCGSENVQNAKFCNACGHQEFVSSLGEYYTQAVKEGEEKLRKAEAQVKATEEKLRKAEAQAKATEEKLRKEAEVQLKAAEEKSKEEIEKLQSQLKAKETQGKASFAPLSDFKVSRDGVLKKYVGIGGEVVIPNTVKSIGEAAFYECTSLIKIVIPNSVTSIGARAFRKCSRLTDVMIPDSVNSIGDRAFWNCTRLKNIRLSNSVTSIGEEIFSGCKQLKEIKLPNSVTSIGAYAFKKCSRLTKIVIPNNVMSIGTEAFSKCTQLTEIEIPNSVMSIGYLAFNDCKNLTKIVIPSSVTSISWNVFENCPNLTIYAESETQPTGWSEDWNKGNRPVVWGYKKEDKETTVVPVKE